MKFDDKYDYVYLNTSFSLLIRNISTNFTKNKQHSKEIRQVFLRYSVTETDELFSANTLQINWS